MVPIYDLSLADAISQSDLAGQGRPYRIRVLRQMTVEPLAPFLKVGGRDFGMEIQTDFGQFDVIFQEAQNPALWQGSPDCVIVCLSPSRFAPELTEQFARQNIQNADAIIGSILERAHQLIGAIRSQTSMPILWLGLYIGPVPIYGLADQRAGQSSQAELLARVNREIDSMLQVNGPGWVIDVEKCAARVGSRAFYDLIRWHESATPFTVAGFREVAVEILKYLRNIHGAIKKVLALDCDNTLWGGLVGEDGAQAVQLSADGYPGGAHRNLQILAASLRARGVLLALISKNVPDNVWEVFDTRKEMLLKRDDVVAARINWAPKFENLRSLAEELNVGLDSFVFLDDQPEEIDAVRRYCPEVSCLQVTEKNLASIGDIFASMGWFEVIHVTATDRIRVESYKADRQRAGLVKEIGNIESYLRDLKLEATLKFDSDVDVKRASQMCRRTNQFNMTTRRHTEMDIDAFIKSKSARVISIGVQDRFGDMGDVGLAIVDIASGRARIDTFLLSCRSFGRHCEDVLLAAILDVARQFGAEEIIGEYFPTKPNAILQEFWTQRGFDVDCKPDGSQLARQSVHKTAIDYPNFYERIEFFDALELERQRTKR